MANQSEKFGLRPYKSLNGAPWNNAQNRYTIAANYGTASGKNVGISNANVPEFTSGVSDNDFLKVSSTSIEGRSASEVLSDIGGASTGKAIAMAMVFG